MRHASLSRYSGDLTAVAQKCVLVQHRIGIYTVADMTTRIRMIESREGNSDADADSFGPQRTRRGTFSAGNSAAVHNAGPARKSATRRGRAALLWLLAQVDAADGENNWHRIWRLVFDKAMAGNMTAAKLMFSYAMGEPRQSIGLDVHRGETTADIPPMSPKMSLAELTSIYQRTLAARDDPDEVWDADVTTVIEGAANPCSDDHGK
jgi:hypothetical protein